MMKQTKLMATGKPLYAKAQKDQELRIGRRAQVTTAARIDCIGTVREIRGNKVVIRVAGWMADGYHMDFYCDSDEVAVVK